ncbi:MULTISPECIES: hypothetical protein [unclassified Variovorax]|uniref:hypothetical protein n=1 Tax=unclassified Variovorax TaxID=663243 RepID=UPI001318B342|nr:MULTISPECIES: hypothetical protein [unclassified Variovorax]VTU43037.1 hypothetical protein H6P1_00341 [Variovorax sp. PBL-H6]VTU43499.1 hypothetical protein SRS16P1_00564 [Variovorax sp. SRS16]VTU43558.1 hypothetical protein E5P1_00558 [Variovorax sp. PBL-E5]
MNTLEIHCELGELSRPFVCEPVQPNQLVHLTLIVDGKPFASTKDETTDGPRLDGNILLAGRLRGAQLFLLNCECGVPECAGVFEPVHVRRRTGAVSWTFSQAYFDYLRSRGFVEGEPREVSFEFDRAAYESLLESAEDFAVAAEGGGKVALLGESERPVAKSILLQLAAERQLMAARLASRWFVSSAAGRQGYEVIRPRSVAGRTPDFKGALPERPSVDRGIRIGVGSPEHHLVYQYQFDDRSGAGHWAYSYTQVDGTLCDFPPPWEA